MLAINSVILLLLSIHVTSCLSLMTRNVYIPSEGENCPGHPCYNISTFGTMADSFSNSPGLVAHFLEGTHLLDELIVFKNLTNAVFEGEGRMEQGFHETVQQSTVVIKCTQHSGGIAFVGGFNITFKYLTIINCGVGMQSLVHKNLKTSLFSFNATLGFFYAGDVTVDHVSVQNWSSGNGLFAVVDSFDLTIANSSFTRYITKLEPFYSSCNVLVFYTDPLDCVHQSDNYNALIANNNVTSFGGSSETYYNNFGLLVGFMQRIYRVQLMLDSIVTYGIRGFSNVIFSNIAELPNYNVTINNTNSSHGNGEGLVIGTGPQYSYFSTSECSTNLTYSDHDLIIFIDNSVFTYNKCRNTAIRGTCVIAITFLSIQYSPTIKIQSTEISNNVNYSSELCISLIAYQGDLFSNISNVTVNNNSCIYQLPKTQTSNFHQQAAISASFVTSLRLKNVTIAHNNMTGLAVYRTNILVSGGNASVIHNNTGIDGGGLALYGDSYLLLEDDSHLTFTNNTAQRGGAIFVDAASSTIFVPPCFFQFPGLTLSKSAKVTFSNNEAATAGSVVYGGNDCTLYTYNINNTECYLSCFNKTFKYSTQTGLSVLSSEPYDVCFCTNNTPNCSYADDTLSINAYPGEKVNISLVSVGWNNGVVPGTVQMQQLGNLSAESVLFNTTAMSCTTISFTALHSKYSLKIFDTSSPFAFYMVLYLSLSKCPLGFHTSKHSDSCNCDELKKNISLPGTLTCDATTKTMTRQGDVWIGNISDCVVVHDTCPFDYCNSSQVTFTLADPSPQCALNRTGTLCGRCKDRLSLVLGSNNCIECPSGFSYIAFILLYAAAGFGLVAFLMALNLTVSFGTINGLIFYASIVQISQSTGMFLPHASIPVLSQFIAWLNLDLGIEICFYKEMTAYHKVWLQFVFPLYIWFIIVTIIILCRYSKWLSNKIGGNVVQVLATLILLSFTKIFRTFAPALSWVTLRMHCVNNTCNQTTVWYVDGDVPYLSSKHGALIAAAVLFLLLAVPYTLALLFDPLIEKYLTRLRLFRKWWTKLKPFIDAYHGPYKDKCRFWTGLLLLVRMIFTLVSVYLSTYTTLVFITTSSSVLLSLMVFFGGIYQNNYLNILECSSLLNLALLSAIYNPWYDSVKNVSTEHTVAIISVSIALATFVGVVVFHVILRLQNIKHLKNFPIIMKLSRCTIKTEESERLLEDDVIVRRLVEPTTNEVCLRREPLIF